MRSTLTLVIRRFLTTGIRILCVLLIVAALPASGCTETRSSPWLRTHRVAGEWVGVVSMFRGPGNEVRLVVNQSFRDSSGNPGPMRALYLKTDASGRLIWQRQVAETLVSQAIAADDGGVFLFAINDRGSAGLSITRIDVEGRTTWSKILNLDINRSSFNVVRLQDGFLLYWRPSAGTLHVVQIDAGGTVSSERDWAFPGISGEIALGVTSQGDYVTAAATTHGPDPSELVVSKTDGTGQNTNWARRFQSPEIDRPDRIIETADGGILIAGTSMAAGPLRTRVPDSDILLIRLEPDGSLRYRATIGDPYLVESLSDFIETGDGGFVVVGSEQPMGPIGSWGLLARVGKGGEVIWTKTLEHNDKRATSADGIIARSDGGFIAGGSYQGVIGNGAAGIFLMEVDSEGNFRSLPR